jgi:hypothetical protein
VNELERAKAALAKAMQEAIDDPESGIIGYCANREADCGNPIYETDHLTGQKNPGPYCHVDEEGKSYCPFVA